MFKSQSLRNCLQLPHVQFGLLTCGVYFFMILVFGVLSDSFAAIKPFFVVRSLIDACLLLIPYLLLSPAKRKFSWIVTWLFTAWLLSQLWYIRTYHDLMPASSYFLWQNVGTLLLTSVLGSMRWSDLLIVLPPVFLYIAYYRGYRRAIREQKPETWRLRLSVLGIFLVCVLSFMLVECFKYQQAEKDRISASFLSRFTNPCSLGLRYLLNNGIFPCALYSIGQSITEAQEITKQQQSQINGYLAQTKHSTYAGPTMNGKNLIFIVVESLNSWVVNYKVDGKEICPHLNAICNADTTAFVALKMVPQVKDGRSSDGHFIYNTGLLPLRSSSVAVKCGEVPYPALPKALTGYSSVTVVCDEPTMWNQSQAMASYGYQRMVDIYEICKHTGVSDKSKALDDEMFKTALPVMKRMRQPFLAQLITIAMHMPYNEPKVPPTWISRSPSLAEELRNYLETVQYFDKALGNFLAQLKAQGLYDNSVIVIASDHDELCKNVPDHREQILPTDRYCTFVVLNSPVAKHHPEVMGQIDVYPTMLDIMGCKSWPWRGVGQSVLSEPALNSAVDAAGNVVGNARAPQVKRQQEAWTISNTMLSKKYFSRTNKYLDQ